MPNDDHHTDPEADDQAANWAVLLADDPDNEALRARLQAWLDADPSHRLAWHRARRTWEGLGRVEAGTRRAWPEPRALPARRWRWRHLAGLAVAAALLVAVLPTLSLRLSADHLTATGEQRRVTLEDGSQVYLAPESAIRLAIDQRQRRVDLLRGEAFFEVRPEPGRPFLVISGDTRTTVLGTAFNVRHGGQGTRVSVAHGRVNVESDGLRRTLTAGDRLTITADHAAGLDRMPPEDVAGWRRGQLVARDLPIGAVVDALRPYYSGTIIVSDGFARQRVTGLYGLREPAATLSKLAAAHGGTLHRLTPWVLVLND